MKLPRRDFLHLAAGAAALPASRGSRGRKIYPTRPVRIDRRLSGRRHAPTSSRA